MVDASSKQLTIPKKGYVGVVTMEGYAIRFKKSVKVSEVNDSVIEQINSPRGSVYTCGQEIRIISAPINQYSFVLGDSILLAIDERREAGSPYALVVKSMFDEVLQQDSLQQNWKVLNVKNLMLTEEAILIQCRSKENMSSIKLIRKMLREEGAQFNYDFSRIPPSTSGKEFALALYQLNNLFYDHAFLLYQLERSNYQPQNKIFANYIAKQKKKYQFELFDFHK